MHIGQSLQDSMVGPFYHSLRYDFKPASINTEAPGSLTFGIDGQVSLDLLKKSGDETGLAFTGYSEPYEDGLDCVAVFDGTSWTLQLLSGGLKVQHVKGPGRATPPPQAAPAGTSDSSAEQLQSFPMDTERTLPEEGDWSARQQSQDGSEVHAADGYLHSVVPAHDIDPDGDTNSDGEEAEPAHQSAATGAAIQANGIAHQYTNGHAQEPLEVQLRHSDSSESEEEEDDDGQDEEGHGADTMQETERQQDAHVAAGIPMTDLERQFFANSQPQDSSDSSSDSDQESVNAASDDEDDGLDHF